MLDIGIWGATGDLGIEIYKRLVAAKISPNSVFVDPIGKICLAMRKRDVELESIFGARANLTCSDVKPILINDEDDYINFKDCNIIIISAGRAMPEDWAKKVSETGRHSLGGLEEALHDDIRKRLGEKFEYYKKLKGAKDKQIRRLGEYSYLFDRHFPLPPEVDSIGAIKNKEQLNNIIEEEAARILEGEKHDLKEAYEIFEIMKNLKDGGVGVGTRGLFHFPRNVKMIQNYADILRDLYLKHKFNGLIVITTNVPEYCGSIFAARAPELADRVLCLTDFDTMRTSREVVPKHEDRSTLPYDSDRLFKQLIMAIGDHDDGIIFAPELTIDQLENMTVLSSHRQEVDLIRGSIRDKFVNSATAENACLEIELTMGMYAHISKIMRGVTDDAADSVMRLLRAIDESKRYINMKNGEVDDENFKRLDILTNGIFYPIEGHGKGIFVTIPHQMNGLKIAPYDFERMMSDRTRRKFGECKQKLIRVIEALKEHHKIEDWPRFTPIDIRVPNGAPTRPSNIIILARSAEMESIGGKLKINVYYANDSEHFDSLKYDDVFSPKYIAFDGKTAVLKTITTDKDWKNDDITKNRILRYELDSGRFVEKSEKIEVSGNIADFVLNVGEKTYLCSTEDNKEGVIVFDGTKKERVHKTKENREIYSVAVADIMGKRHIIGSSDGTLHVWTENSEIENFALDGGSGYLSNLKVVGNLCFARDIKSKRVYIWDIDKRKLIASYETLNGSYDSRELPDKKAELTIITQNPQNKDEYIIQSFALRRNGTRIDENEPDFKISTTEPPSAVYARGDYIFVSKAGKLCWVEKKPDCKLESIDLENSRLELLCIHGGKDEV